MNQIVRPTIHSLLHLLQFGNTNNRPTVVFHLGAEAGFYSEYNNMVFAIVHCKLFGIGFKLYSADANFGIDKGWCDYFIPFCEEVNDSFHSELNLRFTMDVQTIYFGRYLMSLLRAVKHFDRKRVIPYHRVSKSERVWRRQYGFDYYTYDLWHDFRRWKGILSLSKLQSECKKVVEATYRFNESTMDLVSELVGSLHLEVPYAALHVRAGDKFKEAKLITPDAYMDKLKSLTSIKDVFVFTDDYSVFYYLERTYNDYRFYTLTSPDDHGYDYTKLMLQFKDLSIRKGRMIFLFACIEMMKKSEVFIGTLSANPGLFMGMSCPEKTYYVDSPIWRI